ncbi:MAG: hypothetical protein V8S14_07700 [Lachnospiraceae bacterium]
MGSLSVEYNFDPEDDLTEERQPLPELSVKTLAVVEGVNSGTVSAKKDCTAASSGAWTWAPSDPVKVTAAWKVPAATTWAASLVSPVRLFAIALSNVLCPEAASAVCRGAGESESTVSGCYAMVEINGDGQSTGAISGTETGNFTENYFVSDTLAGLGRISYAGQAEPISFPALAEIPGMPVKMTQFTLRFLVEGEEVKTMAFAYGDSFEADAPPKSRQGRRLRCLNADLTDLHFDKAVAAGIPAMF